MRKLSLWDVSQFRYWLATPSPVVQLPRHLCPISFLSLRLALDLVRIPPGVLILSASSFPWASALFAFGHLKVASVALACVSFWYLVPGAQVRALPPPAGIFLCDIFAFCNIGSICSVVFDLAFGPSCLTR